MVQELFLKFIPAVRPIIILLGGRSLVPLESSSNQASSWRQYRHLLFTTYYNPHDATTGRACFILLWNVAGITIARNIHKPIQGKSSPDAILQAIVSSACAGTIWTYVILQPPSLYPSIDLPYSFLEKTMLSMSRKWNKLLHSYHWSLVPHIENKAKNISQIS